MAIKCKMHFLSYWVVEIPNVYFWWTDEFCSYLFGFRCCLNLDRGVLQTFRNRKMSLKTTCNICRNISDENHWHRFLRWKELGWNRNTSAPSSNFMAMLPLKVFFLLCQYFFRYDGIFNQPLAKQSNGKLSYRQISIGVFLLLMFRYSIAMVQ